MIRGFLVLMILATSVRGLALAKSFSCKQVKMAPEEIAIDGMMAVPGAGPSTLVVHKVTPSSSTLKEFTVSATPSTDAKIKIQFISSDLSLVISNTEGRASDGDFGYLAQFSGKAYPAQELICWFFKHSK